MLLFIRDGIKPTSEIQNWRVIRESNPQRSDRQSDFLPRGIITLNFGTGDRGRTCLSLLRREVPHQSSHTSIFYLVDTRWELTLQHFLCQLLWRAPYDSNAARSDLESRLVAKTDTHSTLQTLFGTR